MTADIPMEIRDRSVDLPTGGRAIAPRGHLWKVDPEDGSLDWYAYDYVEMTGGLDYSYRDWRCDLGDGQVNPK